MSLPARRAKRIDANQPEIVKALRRVGIAVWVMSSPADLLTGHQGRFRTLEVKDGNKPPSARLLTPEENAYAGTCQAMRLPHYIVLSVDEALAVHGFNP